MSQFTKLYDELFKQGCTPNQATILSMIFDRFNSSKKLISFYSTIEKDYYVIFTYEELANLLNISLSTVRYVLKQCIKDNYIYTELKNNHVNLIYLTDKSKAIIGNDR